MRQRGLRQVLAPARTPRPADPGVGIGGDEGECCLRAAAGVDPQRHCAQ